MFGRDSILPLNKLLQPKIRYLGNDENILSLETLKNLSELVATNLRFARQRYGNKNPIKESQIKEGDLVLIKNNPKRGFQPRFLDNYRVVRIKGQQVEV